MNNELYSMVTRPQSSYNGVYTRSLTIATQHKKNK